MADTRKTTFPSDVEITGTLTKGGADVLDSTNHTFDNTGTNLAATTIQAAIVEVDADLATHAGAADPHTVYQLESEKGVANGYASLDGSGLVPTSQLPASVTGAVEYKGAWDANAGSDPTVSPEQGFYYVVSVAGSHNLDGITDWKIGDWAIYNGTVWEKVDNTESVTSVYGRTGAIVAATSDYDASQVDNDSTVTGAQVSDALNTLKTQIDDHEAAADPHTMYQKESEKGAANGYASLDGSTLVPEAQLPGGSVTTHVGAADPHTQYQKESEKSAVNGYASLDGSGTVPTGELPAAALKTASDLYQDGSSVIAEPTEINYTGDLVTVTDDTDGTATIDINHETAALSSVGTTATTIYSFDSTVTSSVKLLIYGDNATNKQVSEFLVLANAGNTWSSETNFLITGGSDFINITTNNPAGNTIEIQVATTTGTADINATVIGKVAA